MALLLLGLVGIILQLVKGAPFPQLNFDSIKLPSYMAQITVPHDFNSQEIFQITKRLQGLLLELQLYDKVLGRTDSSPDDEQTLYEAILPYIQCDARNS